MNILLLVLLTFVAFCEICAQLYEGDICTDNVKKENGICKLITDCPEAATNIQKGVYPTSCGFVGNNIIICCVSTKTKETVSQQTTTKKSDVVPQVSSRKSGEISDQMCRNYAQYVWTTEYNPTLIIDAEDIVKRDCPFDKLELVVGGTRAENKEFPHMVQLGFGEKQSIEWGCGGSLVSDQFVLTAAHCLEHKSFGLVSYARMGITDLDDLEHLQQFDIIQRIAHPDFKPPSHYNDIALVKLDKKPKLNIYVRPACIYTSRSSPWSNVIAVGWGNTQFGGESSPYLLRVILELYDNSSCGRIYRQQIGTKQLHDGIKDESMICAGHSKELKDTCQGDSGGPLQVYRTGGGSNMSCMYDIIGVTSFGKACGLSVNLPGVYTRVSNYLKWIEDILWPEQFNT